MLPLLDENEKMRTDMRNKQSRKTQRTKGDVRKQKQIKRNNSSNVWLLHLIVFLVSFLSHEAGFLQLVLKSIHTLFIGQGTVLKNLACTVCLNVK